MRRLTPAAAAGRPLNQGPRRGPSDAQLLMKRRLARWTPRHVGRIVGGLLVAALVGIAVAGTANLLSRHSALGRVALATTAELGLSVQSVEVEGRVMTAPADILKAIGVERGTPILGINPAQAKNRIEGLPWVRAATVERRLPGTIRVHLTERQPLALWQYHGQMMLIDHEGVIVTTENLGRFASLLLVVGENAPNHTTDLLALLEREPTLAKQAQSAVWVANRRWDIHLANGITVMLPEADPAAAWSHLARVERDHGLMARKIDLIDLRLADRVVVHVVPEPVKAPTKIAKIPGKPAKAHGHHATSAARPA